MRFSLLLLVLGALGACTPYLSGREWRFAQDIDTLQGRIRLDRAPEDAPFTATDLADHFRLTVFVAENEDLWDRPDFGGDEAKIGFLRRWNGGFSYRFIGFSEDAVEMEALVDQMAERLGRLTGLEIQGDTDGPEDLSIFLMRPVDYDPLIAILPQGPNGDLLRHEIASFGKSNLTPCAFLPFFGPEEGAPIYPDITAVMILIKDNLPDRFQKACVEEEMAQAMGLMNDHDSIRPSVFNDDQEFALLTTHDELLLRILYDPRLKAGMTEAEAMPIVRRIAAELLPQAGG